MKYIGNELHLFEKANNWKSYFNAHLCPFIKGDVLEVGAGIGATTQVLLNSKVHRWTCLEPDNTLAMQIQQKLRSNQLSGDCELAVGSLADIPSERKFDTILYIDVLEHIEDDVDEFRHAASHLKQSGHIVVLSPAHQWLYTPFDQSIGHVRRYSKETLGRLTAGNVALVSLYYIDSMGLLASSLNRFFLKSSMPNNYQIKIWNNLLVPMSRVTDAILGYRVGKTIIGIWKKYPL